MKRNDVFSRRDLMLFLRNTLGVYGVSQLPLSLFESIASAAPTGRPEYFIAVFKHWGSKFNVSGPGARWNFDGFLKPLAGESYRGDIAIPLGLRKAFNAPIDGHTIGQHSFLTGAPLQFESGPIHFLNPGAGGGKSIDVILGQLLQARFGSRYRNLGVGQRAAHAGGAPDQQKPYQNKIVSYDPKAGDVGGQNMIYSFVELRSTIKGEVVCNPTSGESSSAKVARLKSEIKVLKDIQKQNGDYLNAKEVPRQEFRGITDSITSKIKALEADLKASGTGGPVTNEICNHTPAEMQDANVLVPQVPADLLARDKLSYELLAIGLKSNVTRSVVITHNPIINAAHFHDAKNEPENKAIADREIMASIASVKELIDTLKRHGIYEKTCILYQVELTDQEAHTNHEVAAFVVNSGVHGLRGNSSTVVPCSELLLDMLKLYGAPYTEFGSPLHTHGVARKGILKVA